MARRLYILGGLALVLLLVVVALTMTDRYRGPGGAAVGEAGGCGAEGFEGDVADDDVTTVMQGLTQAGGQAASQEPGFAEALLKYKPVMTWKLSNTLCQGTVALSGVAQMEVSRGKHKYRRLGLWGGGKLAVIGKPELPYVPLLFAVPPDAKTGKPVKWTVQVSLAKDTTTQDVLVLPAQPDTPDEEQEYEDPPFAVDEAFYKTTALYPQVAYDTAAFRAGNLDLLQVRVYPVRYRPGSRQLVVAGQTSVTVSFGGVPGKPVAIGDYAGVGRPGDAILAGLLVNGSLVQLAGQKDFPKFKAPAPGAAIPSDEAYSLLILTRTDLSSEAVRLAHWRQEHDGLRVKVAVLSPTCATPECVRDYILAQDLANRYKWPYPPVGLAYLQDILLFGDVEAIPVFPGMNAEFAANPEVGQTVEAMGTDLPYSAIRGTDDIPDVGIGRISVDSLEEAAAVVDKIIAYDGLPGWDMPHKAAVYAHFEDEVTLQAQYDDVMIHFTEGSDYVAGSDTHFLSQVEPGQFIQTGDADEEDFGYEVASVVSDTELHLVTERWCPTSWHDGLRVSYQDSREDKPFVEQTERIYSFLTGKGVEVRWGYTRTNGPQPARMADGRALPIRLLDYGWNANAALVRGNWNQGVDGLVVHRDHANTDGWGHPTFFSGDVVNTAVAEKGRYPVVFSINCLSGRFNGELRLRRGSTGSIAETWEFPDAPESFCEQALMDADGGAVAIIGASQVSYSETNNLLTDSLMKALYPDYASPAISVFSSGTSVETLGQAMLIARIHIALMHHDPVVALYYLQMYNLFGDPTMVVRLPEASGGLPMGAN